MSRIVVATLGSVGDLHPFLAVAREAARQGHSVLFLSSEPHRTAVEAEGLRFEPILTADEHWQAAHHPALWHPLRGFGVLWRYLAIRSLQTVLKILRRETQADAEPLRVLASPLVLGARLAADVLPIRLVTGHTAPSGIRHLDNPLFLGAWRVPAWWPRAWRQLAWRVLDAWKLEPLGRPVIDHWRSQHGLPAAPAPLFGSWLQSPHRVIGFFPDWLAPRDMPHGAPLQTTGFPLFRPATAPPLDDTLARWLHRDLARPRLVLYGGSSTGPHAVSYRDALGQLDAQGWPVLLIATDMPPGALGQHSLVRPWADLAQVLPACSGWIHHGGIGACAEGLHAGLRPWVLPSAYDQFDNAERLANRIGLPVTQVVISPSQLARGELPGLGSLARWQHPAEPIDPCSAVEAALTALMGT